MSYKAFNIAILGYFLIVYFPHALAYIDPGISDDGVFVALYISLTLRLLGSLIINFLFLLKGGAKKDLRQAYIVYVLCISTGIELIDITLLLGTFPEYFYYVSLVIDTAVFFVWISYMVSREYSFLSDKPNDKDVFFVFKQPSDTRTLLYGLFGKPISGFSVIYQGHWYRYNSETFIYEKRPLKYVPEEYIVKKTDIRPTKAKKAILEGLIGSKLSKLRIIKTGCTTLHKPFLKECGINVKPFDFYPPRLAKRLLK